MAYGQRAIYADDNDGTGSNIVCITVAVSVTETTTQRLGVTSNQLVTTQVTTQIMLGSVYLLFLVFCTVLGSAGAYSYGRKTPRTDEAKIAKTEPSISGKLACEEDERVTDSFVRLEELRESRKISQVICEKLKEEYWRRVREEKQPGASH